MNLRKLKRWIEVHTCDHEFVSDKYITVIECTKCGGKYHFTYHDIYDKEVRKFLKMKLT